MHLPQIALFKFIGGHGIDGGGGHFRCQCHEGFIGRLIFNQRLQRGIAAVGLFDDGRILIISQIVADTGEAGRDRIDPLPYRQIGLGHGEGHQQGAAVQAILILGKIHLPVPHHGAEILLQNFIALVVAPGLELGVVHHGTGHSGFGNAPGIIDLLQLIPHQIGHTGIHPHTALQGRPNVEVGHISRSRFLPLGSFQRLIQAGGCFQHGNAQVLQLPCQLVFLRAVQQETEIQMEGVHHGVHRHIIGDLGVTVILIGFKKLGAVGRRDQKQILFQQFRFLFGEVELIQIDHIGKGFRRSVGRHRRLRRRNIRLLKFQQLHSGSGLRRERIRHLQPLFRFCRFCRFFRHYNRFFRCCGRFFRCCGRFFRCYGRLLRLVLFRLFHYRRFLFQTGFRLLRRLLQQGCRADDHRRAGCHGQHRFPDPAVCFSAPVSVGFLDQSLIDFAHGINKIFLFHRSNPSLMRYSRNACRVRYRELFAVPTAMPQSSAICRTESKK